MGSQCSVVLIDDGVGASNPAGLVVFHIYCIPLTSGGCRRKATSAQLCNPRIYRGSTANPPFSFGVPQGFSPQDTRTFSRSDRSRAAPRGELKLLWILPIHTQISADFGSTRQISPQWFQALTEAKSELILK